jgi:hypothetical protein
LERQGRYAELFSKGLQMASQALSTVTDFQVSSPAMGKGNGTFSVSTRYFNDTPQPDVTQITVQNRR